MGIFSKLAATTAVLALAGCATPYQEMGALGGVKATRFSADTVLITAKGNAYTDEDTVQAYAMRRAAEETIADGYDLFRIEGDADRTRSGTASFVYAGGNRRSAFASAFSIPMIEPGQTLTIKMIKGPKPEPMPDGLFDAREVESYLAGAPYAGHKNCKPDASGKIVCI